MPFTVVVPEHTAETLVVFSINLEDTNVVINYTVNGYNKTHIVQIPQESLDVLSTILEPLASQCPCITGYVQPT